MLGRITNITNHYHHHSLLCASTTLHAFLTLMLLFCLKWAILCSCLLFTIRLSLLGKNLVLVFFPPQSTLFPACQMLVFNDYWGFFNKWWAHWYLIIGMTKRKEDETALSKELSFRAASCLCEQKCLPGIMKVEELEEAERWGRGRKLHRREKLFDTSPLSPLFIANR